MGLDPKGIFAVEEGAGIPDFDRSSPAFLSLIDVISEMGLHRNVNIDSVDVLSIATVLVSSSLEPCGSQS